MREQGLMDNDDFTYFAWSEQHWLSLCCLVKFFRTIDKVDDPLSMIVIKKSDSRLDDSPYIFILIFAVSKGFSDSEVGLAKLAQFAKVEQATIERLG